MHILHFPHLITAFILAPMQKIPVLAAFLMVEVAWFC